MKLEVIRTLVAVYDSGSVVSAARAQGYSPSAVSRQIGAVQREIGTTFFEPDGRGIRPTPQLIDLVDEMRDMIEHADRLQARLREIRGRHESGTSPPRLKSRGVDPLGPTSVTVGLIPTVG